MLLIKTNTAYSLKFFFSDSYGTITESDYSLSIRQDNSKTHYNAGDHTFSIVQPVLGVSQGYMTVSLTAPTTPQPVTVELYKLSGNDFLLIDTIRVKAVIVETQIVSPTTQY